MNRLARLASLTLLGAALPAASGTLEVSLRPASQTVTLGTRVTVELWWDFSGEPALGGGLDVAYDAARLDFVSFMPTAAPVVDPALNRAPADLPGLVSGIAAGTFDGVAGPVLIGTLTFEAIGAGTADLAPGPSADPVAGPFVSDVSLAPYPPGAVGFSAAQVTVTAGDLIFENGFE